jgi:hypothetical protein
MLSVLLSATTITMNRGEQENLFRQSRNLRLQDDVKIRQPILPPLNLRKPSQQPLQEPQDLLKPRHYSHGNIHQISNLHMQSLNSRSFCDDRPFSGVVCDDLVLSVLKSPVRDPTLPTNPATPSPQPPEYGYSALQGSEDELVDDIESAVETTKLDITADTSPRALKFLRRFRTGRPQQFEAHHRRVPTPIRRKHNRGRSKSRGDILDGVNAAQGKCLFRWI